MLCEPVPHPHCVCVFVRVYVCVLLSMAGQVCPPAGGMCACSGASVGFRFRLLRLALGVLAFLAELLAEVAHVHIGQHLLDGGRRCIPAIPTLLNKHAKPMLHIILRDLFSVLKLQILTVATELSLA